MSDKGIKVRREGDGYVYDWLHADGTKIDTFRAVGIGHFLCQEIIERDAEIERLVSERQQWRSRMGLKCDSDLVVENERLTRERDEARACARRFVPYRKPSEPGNDSVHDEWEKRWPWLMESEWEG